MKLDPSIIALKDFKTIRVFRLKLAMYSTAVGGPEYIRKCMSLFATCHPTLGLEAHSQHGAQTCVSTNPDPKKHFENFSNPSATSNFHFFNHVSQHNAQLKKSPDFFSDTWNFALHNFCCSHWKKNFQTPRFQHLHFFPFSRDLAFFFFSSDT